MEFCLNNCFSATVVNNIEKAILQAFLICAQKPPWRNWLARSAVNRKVGGSSPPGGEMF